MLPNLTDKCRGVIVYIKDTNCNGLWCRKYPCNKNNKVLYPTSSWNARNNIQNIKVYCSKNFNRHAHLAVSMVTQEKKVSEVSIIRTTLYIIDYDYQIIQCHGLIKQFVYPEFFAMKVSVCFKLNYLHYFKCKRANFSN